MGFHLGGNSVISYLHYLRAENISEVHHLLGSRISEMNCPQTKTVLLATDNQGSQKINLGWVGYFYLAEVR